MPSAVAHLLKADYTLPLSDVYLRAATAFIQVCEDLEPLRDGNPWGPSGCPSWAADWLWEGRDHHSRERQQLWGPSYLFPRHPEFSKYVLYYASGDIRAQALTSKDGLLLKCEGFVVDRIAGLSARDMGYFEWNSDTVIPDQNFRSIYGNREATTDALVRTLIEDLVESWRKAGPRHAAILHLPSSFVSGGPQFARRRWNFLAGQRGYYFRWELFRAVIRDFPLGDYLFDQIFSDQLPLNASEYDLTEVYSCFYRTSQRRRSMTTENGYIGWAPDNIFGDNTKQTRPGDQVAIIFGCSTPVIIRAYGEERFQVLGEAYVQGLMGGEAIRALQDGKYQRREFVLS